jgi:hypothetical protein
MSRISRDIYTSLDVNGPYIRIDTQPTSITSEHNQNGTFTLAASTYYLTGDEAEIGDIDVLEADAVAPTDAGLDNQTPGVPHTAKDQGYISYQWYEINEISGETIKLTNSVIYSGVTTNTLTVHNTLSPGSHLNQYYCVLDYIPTTVGGEFDTGNAVNDAVTSDTVTLNVRPYIIINTQPITTTTFLNPDSGTTSTKASLSDTRFPWDDYRLEFQWWEKNRENVSAVADIRFIDGDYSERITGIKRVESVVNRIQTTVLTESITAGQSKRVGIPTEAVDVTFTLASGAGGNGGNENISSLGGSGGRGKTGEFKFSSSELFEINNSGPTEYILAAGTKGSDGTTGTSANGGSGGYSFDLDTAATSNRNDSANGGKGGNSGPGGISGTGGGGGASSFIIKSGEPKWLAIAGGGGGGGGGSKDASGFGGVNANEWIQHSQGSVLTETKQATVVNYNPIAGTGSNPQDKIDYGFYIKSSSPLSSPTVRKKLLNTTDSYRVVVIWGETVVVNESSTKLLKTADNRLYVNGGGQSYFLQTYRDSQLGWCNVESNVDTVCVRGDGGYVNSFDVYRITNPSSGSIIAYDGANGTDKTIGDGSGGGGGGGGAIAPTTGGSVGKDPIPAVNVDLTFKVTQTASRRSIGSSYIEFVEVPWYGVNPDTEPSRGQVVRFNRDSPETQTVSLLTNKTYDVYSSFEDGRTSDSLRILQDFTQDANQGDIIAGRSIGFNLDGGGENIQTGNENDFRDFIISVSDGTFDISPQTVKLDDGEIVGKAIIRFTTPAEVRNSVSATGGEGGASQYSSDELQLISNSLNGGPGSITMTVTTEQPYDTLEEEIVRNSYNINYSIRGAHPYTPYKESGYTSNLIISADYALSKRILCQISAIDTSFVTRTLARTSFSNTVYTDIVDFIVLDGRDNTITIEGIRHNNNFAILSSNNLDNGDLTIERSGSTNVREIEYYSFYSNQDLEVDVKLFGGKGNDVNGNAGGEGGFSYLRLNMEANTEYVIAGLNEYINTPYLFKGGRLLACVGGGGDANVSGPGGSGGGVSMSGGSAFKGGGGGTAPIQFGGLTLTGVIGSASNNNPIAPDTKALIPDGGRTIRCSKGNLFQFNGQPDPCESKGSSVKFDFGGVEVTNTRNISRGFKAGYNILKTGGRSSGAIINRGWGGSGATGGQGNDSFGGGGGSGFIIPDATTDIFVRSEGNAEILASGTTLSGLQGTGQDTISSFLGGSTGNAKVVISLAEIQSRFLPEFIERPADTDLIVVEEDVVPEPVFVPLPEIVPPPPVTPPNPRMSITNVVSKGWNAGDITYSTITGQSKHFVLESGSLDVNVRTDDIPANTPFYWKITRLLPNGGGSQYTVDDFEFMSGTFRTFKSGSLTVGSFNINPTEDSQTDFIGGNQDWRFHIYSDPDGIPQNRVATFNGVITTLDTSLTAPVAKFTSLTADGPGGNLNARAKNSISEGEPARQIDFATTDIPNGSTVKWYIKNVTSQNADFVATSGTATVTSRFTLHNPDAYAIWNGSGSLSTANQGTGSFTIRAVEDSSTEGSQFFGLQIEYPVGSGTIIADSTAGTNPDDSLPRHIRILDTSINPGATISGSTSVEEGATLTLTVDTNSIATNSVIYWKIFKSDNSEVDENDFTRLRKEDLSAITGSFTVNPTSLNSSFVRLGQETFDIGVKGDGVTEPTENFVVKLYRDEARTIALNTPGTSTHSTHSFSVVNTSFSTPVYAMAFGDGNTRTDDYGTIQYAETDAKITVRFRAWHLNPSLADSTGADIYFAVVDSSNAFADAGTVSRTTFPDFDINRGDLRLVFKGYVTNQGDTSGAVATSTATKFTPYWEVSKEIIPREDYFDDGDKDFEIKLYKSSANRDSLSTFGRIGDALEFNLKDTSKPIYQFNTVHGYGTSDSSGINATGGTASLSEGFLYSFRIETTNVAGTRLWYAVSGREVDDEEDFDDVFTGRNRGQHPGPPTGYRPIRNSRYYYVYGDLETFAPNAEIDRVSDKYGNLIAGGTNLDRSIAFIFIKPKEDYVTEGAETFNIDVYNDSSEDTEYLVATVTVNIFPSSAPAAPTITLTCDPASVNSGDLYTVKWVVSNVSEDNLKDERTNDNRIIGGPGIGDITSANLTSNSSVSVTSYSNAREGGKTVYSYSATVYNKAGKAVNDNASVTVNVPHILGCMASTLNPNGNGDAPLNPTPGATLDDGSCEYYVAPPPPPVLKRYRVYPLWRYYRIGSNKMDRYAHNPSYTFQDFRSLPTTMPPGTPGHDSTPPFNGNRTKYIVQGALGGVFLEGDVPPGAVHFTSIQGKLDNAMFDYAKVGWYCFNTNVVGSKLMNIYESDRKWKEKTIGESYQLRDVGDNAGLLGWLSTNRNTTYKFYLMNGIYDDPAGTWWWNDTR